MEPIDVWVPGRPFPQGSKKAFVAKNGRAVIVESSGANLKSWRTGIKEALASTLFTTTVEPVLVQITLAFRRPAAHFGTGRRCEVLKDSAPARPFNRSVGDVDKLARAVLDAVVHAQVLADDSQVVDLVASKVWAGDLPTSEEGLRLEIVPAGGTIGYRLARVPGELRPAPAVG